MVSRTPVAKSILVADDDERTAKLITLYLKREGHAVTCAYNGIDALRVARDTRPDLIILDLMLPGIDGIDVCRRLRSESGVLIIMLTARSTERDKLIGLDAGADDYVVKPFSPSELVARARAVLRRVPDVAQPSGRQRVSFGDLEIDFTSASVTRGGEPVAVTGTEFRLLAALTREPGRVFSRTQLVDLVYGHGYEGTDRSVDVHVANLRRKIECDPHEPRYVHTAFGLGYRFAPGDPQ